MKTAISLPDPLFEEAEAAAKDLGVSRSKLIQTALEEFLKRKREVDIADAIYRYLAKYGNELSPEDEAWLAQSWETVSRELGPEDWGPPTRAAEQAHPPPERRNRSS
jgi:predicted transcriptional regulator